MKTSEAVKERPILFSTPMVQAILEGRKTVTRRIVAVDERLAKDITKWGYSIFTPEGCISARTKQPTAKGYRYGEKWIKLKYGKPKDILWVRETFMYSDVKCTWDDESPSQVQVLYKASNDLRPDGIAIEEFGCAKWINVTSEKAEQIECDIEDQEQEGDRWKPSIHMLKEACRLKLKIVSIGVERLHDITEEDAIREGAKFYEAEIMKDCKEVYQDFPCDLTARESFQTLWESINGDESWEANPWVWRIEFERL